MKNIDPIYSAVCIRVKNFEELFLYGNLLHHAKQPRKTRMFS